MRPFTSLLATLMLLVAGPSDAAVDACDEVRSTSGTGLLDAFVREPGVAFRGGVAYGPGPRHRLDVYASCAAPRGPIVLFFYGGAWTSGDRSTYEFVGTALASRGVTTVIADYRLYPEARFPAFVDDAARAYAWVDRHLGSRGRRPIFLAGHSAGAHIAALLAYDRRYLARGAPEAHRPAGLVGLSGPYAFDPTTWRSTRSIFASAAAHPDAARPIAFASSGAPPTLLLHGRFDGTVAVDNARDLATKLTAAGAEARLVEYPLVGHAGLVLALARPLRWRASVLDDIVAFVETHAGRRTRVAGDR